MRSGVWALLLVACGARSGLEVDVEPRADAGPRPPVDSGLIAFPCRWAPLGIDIEMFRSISPITRIAGYIHPERAVIVARAEMRAVLADIGPRPEILLGFGLEFGTLGVAASGEDLLFAYGCRADWRDAAHAIVGRVDFASEPSECVAAMSSVPGTLDVLRAGETSTEVWRADAATVGGDPVRVFGPIPIRSRTGLAVEGLFGMFVVLEEDGRLSVHHQRGDAVSSMSLGPAEPFALAPDVLVGGAIVVRQGRIDRIEPDPLRVERLRDLDGLRIASRTIAWSTTEVVFVLDDGSLAFMPYFGSDLRIEPNAVPPSFGEAEVVLRNGGTEGGILYTMEEGGDFVLFYRPLVCNR